jgi:hypothetical protein
MVGTSFGWPWSKAKKRRSLQFQSQLKAWKHFLGVVSSYVLVSLHKEYEEEAFTVIKVIFSLYW